MIAPLLVRCPNCGQKVAWTAESSFKPFCSERCRLIDLGEWFAAEKTIAGSEFVEITMQNPE
jgi:endogenous inhibitor of DNA gyrase (YacG/DUF329 family)